jgi:hypothetical protein
MCNDSFSLTTYRGLNAEERNMPSLVQRVGYYAGLA